MTDPTWGDTRDSDEPPGATPEDTLDEAADIIEALLAENEKLRSPDSPSPEELTAQLKVIEYAQRVDRYVMDPMMDPIEREAGMAEACARMHGALRKLKEARDE